MRKPLAVIIHFVLAGGLTGLAFAAQKPAETASAKPGTWTGWLTDDMCAEKGASANHGDCVRMCVSEHGARYALYDPITKKLYILDPAQKFAPHAGEQVVIQGALDGHKIHVASIHTAPVHGS